MEFVDFLISVRFILYIVFVAKTYTILYIFSNMEVMSLSYFILVRVTDVAISFQSHHKYIRTRRRDPV